MSSNDRPTVLLFTADPVLDALLAALEANGLRARAVASEAEAQDLLAAGRQGVVAVLDTHQPASHSFAAIYTLLHAPERVPTLLLLHGATSELPAALVLHARDDYVQLPASVEELVLRIEALVLQTGRALPGPPVVRRGGERSSARFRSGQVVAVFGPRGGVGCSTIAANLATGLARFYGKHVALVDADLWFGAQEVLLDLRSDKTIATLASVPAPIDVDMLRQVFVSHDSGIRVLLAPSEPELVETIPSGLPADITKQCRTLFDFTVVDTHCSLEEYVLQLLEVADRIVLVTTPELTAIHNAGQVLKLAPTLGLSDKLLLVVNRANSGVDLKYLEQTLGMPLTAALVSAGRQMVAAANQGEPGLLLDPEGHEQITRDLGELVARIAGQTAPHWESKPGPRFWPWPHRQRDDHQTAAGLHSGQPAPARSGS